MKISLANKNTALIISTLIFLLSIFLRSRMDVGGDSALNVDLAAKIAHGGKYYYDFFESNFPLTLWITLIPYSLSQFFNISPLIAADIFVDLIGIASLFFSARILKKSTLRPDHQNLLIISFALSFFLRNYALEVNEFVTKGSFLIALFFPYLSYSFPRKIALTKMDLIWRGSCAGLLCCLKPHYIILPLLIEIERFRQKKSLKFFVELDKLVIGAVGLIYLFLMLKFTPEFFEFIIPMSSATYSVYADPDFFWSRTVYHLFSKVSFLSGFFLVFARQQFTREDKILFLVFIAACLMIIVESLGCVDQEATFFALTNFIFIKIFYDFIRSKNFDFSQNKLVLGFLLIFLILEPSSITLLMQTTFFYWVIIAIVMVNFYRDLRDKKIKISLSLPPKLILLILLLIFVTLFVFVVKYVVTNAILIFLITIIFLFILFYYEKIRKNYYSKFSSAFVFFQLALILILIASYLTSIASTYRGQHIFKTPNFLSDNIINYSKAHLTKESDQISIWSYFISESFPALTSLRKVNNYVGSTAGILYNNIGNRFFKHYEASKTNLNSTLNYFLNDLKLQIRNLNMKIIFVDSHYPCKVGFLENYFDDAEFKKIFLENYHFAGRIFLSKKIKDNQENLDLSSYRTVYDFEIYVRNDE